jgi:hypothetical protein
MLSGYPRAGSYSALGSLSSSSAWWGQSGEYGFDPLMSRGWIEILPPDPYPFPNRSSADDRLTPIRYDDESMLWGWNLNQEEPFLVAVE